MKRIILIIGILCIIPLSPFKGGNVCLSQPTVEQWEDYQDILNYTVHAMDDARDSVTLLKVIVINQDSINSRQKHQLAIDMIIIANTERQVRELEKDISALRIRVEDLSDSQLKWWHYAGAAGLVAYAIYITWKFFEKK